MQDFSLKNRDEDLSVMEVQSWKQQAVLRLKEGLLIALVVICVFFWMSLATFDANDPGFTNINVQNAPIRNAGGPLGAWISDVLFSVLGYFAWIFPLILMFKIAQVFVNRYKPMIWNGWLFTLRASGFCFLVATGAALTAIHFQEPANAPANFNILGKALGFTLEQLLGTQGSSLLLIAAFLFGFTAFSNLSWFAVMEAIGRFTLGALDWGFEKLKAWWQVKEDKKVFDDEEDEPLLAPKLMDEEPDFDEDSFSALDDFEPDHVKPRAAPVTADEPVKSNKPIIVPPARSTSKSVVTEDEETSDFIWSGFDSDRHEPVVSDDFEFDNSEPVMLTPPQKARAHAEKTAPVTHEVDETFYFEPDELDELDEQPYSSSLVGSKNNASFHRPVANDVDFGFVDDEDDVPVLSQPAREPVAITAPDPIPTIPVPQFAQTMPGMQRETVRSLPPLPSVELLDAAEIKEQSYSEESLQEMSHVLETKLKEFGVSVRVESVHPGPVVTRFEILLAAGVKVSRITNLAKDLARSMAMTSVRVVEVIQGKTTVGIEVPNENRQVVRLIEVIDSPEFQEAKSPVALALGHDIGGQPVTADLAKMPHLLVAGTTGSGKSVGVNAMILSVLFKSTPEEVRMIMIDPKMLELSIYEGIPHLLCPVVTDMKEAANALRWCVAEMERRYKLLAAVGVRNLAGYNRKVKDAQEIGRPLSDPLYRKKSIDDLPPPLDKLSTIVVVIDEFADMMMIVDKKTVEELIARIAQKARAAGIHLILATQRPSVDVITGLIKANVPTRMAFQVSSKIDSRTILDQGGAEQLLGYGDMLFLAPGTSVPNRVHGAFVSDDEVHRVVEAWKQRGTPEYIDEILAGAEDDNGSEGFEGTGSDEDDPLYDEAVQFVTQSRRASISAVQRKLRVGYNRAARMIEAMEAAGVVSAPSHNGSRDVIAPPPYRD